MSATVCLFTGSFNPPCGHHQEAARLLAAAFGDVRVIPCGYRPDQPHANEVQPTLRAALADLAFGRLPGVTVEHSDIEANTFTPSIDLEARFAPHGEVWHAVWYDMVEGGAAGEAGVQTRWTNGREAWDTLRFVVLKRTSDTVVAADLPPRSRVIEVPNWWYSRDVRLTIYSGETPPPEVMDPAVLAIQGDPQRDLLGGQARTAADGRVGHGLVGHRRSGPPSSVLEHRPTRQW